MDSGCRALVIQEDGLLRKLAGDGRFGEGEKLHWGEIAEELNQLGSKRSGKQCRER